jgi:hypothetical protein
MRADRRDLYRSFKLVGVARVVVTHGINNTFHSRPQMAQAWGPALLGGVELAAGTRHLLHADDIEYAFFGDVFRPAGRFLTGGGIPPLTAADVDEDLEYELLMCWWASAADADPAVIAPSARTLGVRTAARAALLALASSTFFAAVSERMLVWWLKQMAGYLSDPAIREAVQSRFAASVDGDTRVLVAHSFGTVVAYEALCAHPTWQVTDLVTLGSPLGAPYIVLDRLVPPPRRHNGTMTGEWPGAVKRWVNVTDERDFLAVQPRLQLIFGDRVTDVTIVNGINAHQLERYLSAAETGAAIVAGLR